MLRVVAATLFLIVAFAASAFACDCIAPPEPPEALKKSDAVFVGKVTNIARGNSHWRSVTFEVEKTWKGVEGKSVHVVTRLNSAACGFSFEDGNSYLVYANFVGGDGPDAKTLSTNICTRTTFVSEATKAEFEALGPAKMREP